MRKLYLLLAFSFLTLVSFAQGETNIWYFGSYAGVDFNSGSPVALTNGALITAEGCATMCNKNGSLLFYTDGITVWNRNHTPMPNGFGLLGDPSSAQSAIIVPKPGSTTWFYVFTVAAQGGAAGFCYSEIDLTLNGGLGDVVAATKNTPLFTPAVEKITAVKHANGLYVWVIAHGFNNNRYYSYLVNCNGVNAPITTDVGQIEGWPGWGYLVASPDGTKLASAMRNVGFELLDFNNSTGIISNPVFLGNPTECYGVSFSPNNNVLYGLKINDGSIWQWNLQSGSPAAIIASMVQIGTAAGTASPYLGGAMQLGPDGKLYITQYNQPFLSAINNPNTLGLGCNLQLNAVDLLGRISRLGLPPFIQSYFDTTALINYSGVCSGQPVSFSISGNTSFLDSLNWNFNDPASGAANTSSLLSPTHTFSAAGTYNVRLIRYLDCISDTAYVSVNILAPVSSSQNITICPGSSFTLPDGVSVNAAGTYTSTITASTGCDSVVTTNLSVATLNVDAGPNVAICNGSSTTLSATGGLIYSWTPTAGLSDPNISNPVASPSSTTTYTVSTQVEVGNAILNGDFSAGNTGFSSSYVYKTPPNTTEGQYWVSTNAQAWNGGMAPCGDHTTGTGNMLLVNGATTANVPIWCQTVPVEPNSTYAFSTWLATLTASNPAQLQFSINGALLGSVFTASNTNCSWQQFYTTWNSGNNTSANICIVNQNTIASGNDFAIDDISFALLCTGTDTVTVTVHNPTTTIIDTAICNGATYTFPQGNTSTVSVSDTALLTDQFGCDSTVITNLTVHPTPITLITDTICANQTYTLPLGNTVNTTGVYYDTLTTTLGCDSIVITDLTVLPLSATSVFDTICSGSSYTLPNGNSVSTAGTYSVTLTNAYGCDSTVITVLTVINLSVNITHTNALCFGDANGTITAVAGGGVLPYQYNLLQNGSSIANNTSGNFQNLSAGSYSVSVTDNLGCSVSVSSTISEPAPLTSSHAEQAVSCFGEQDGSISVSATGGTPGYSYSLSNGTTNSTGNFGSLAAGSYPYTVTDANGCADTATVLIYEPMEVLVDVVPDSVTLNIGESIQLNATSNYGASANYLWSPSTSLSCSDCNNPEVTVYNSLTYHLTVSVPINGNNCYAYAQVPVTVIKNYDLFIPNVFTPNGDGNNDLFRLFGNLPALKFIEMKIFNRTGEQVFESNDINFVWDGSYKGKMLEPQVLVYTLFTVFVDNHSEKVFKGSITILK